MNDVNCCAVDVNEAFALAVALCLSFPHARGRVLRAGFFGDAGWECGGDGCEEDAGEDVHYVTFRVVDMSSLMGVVANVKRRTFGLSVCDVCCDGAGR